MNNLKWNDEQILDFAKVEVENYLRDIAYPNYPPDEHGHPDTSIDSGCVPWTVCTDCEITNAKIEERNQNKGEIICNVTADLIWIDNSEFIEEEGKEFLIVVYTELSNLEHGDIEPID